MRWLGEMRGAGRRSIGYTESDHFGDFPLSRLLLAPRPDMSPAQVFYTNGYTTIPGAPDHHLLFPTVWDTSDDSSFLDIASSHDGRTWNWLPGGPFMETAEFGKFDPQLRRQITGRSVGQVARRFPGRQIAPALKRPARRRRRGHQIGRQNDGAAPDAVLADDPAQIGDRLANLNDTANNPIERTGPAVPQNFITPARHVPGDMDQLRRLASACLVGQPALLQAAQPGDALDPHAQFYQMQGHRPAGSCGATCANAAPCAT